MKIAFETWGKLNKGKGQKGKEEQFVFFFCDLDCFCWIETDKSNAVLLHTGLSASSHAKSSCKNQQNGW